MRLYYFHDGQAERGPYQFHELQKEKLTRTTPIWYEGLDQWTTVECLQELAPLIQTPPPFNSRSSFSGPPPINGTGYHTGYPLAEEKPKSRWKIGLSILGGLAIAYFIFALIYNNQTQAEALSELQFEQTIAKAEKDFQEDERKRINEELTKRNMEYRNNWPDYISAGTNDYRYSNLGGVYDLEVKVRNNTVYLLDEVVTVVSYVKSNGDIWKTIEVPVTNVPASGFKTVSVPDVERGTSVEIGIKSIVSKKMHFYMSEGYSSGNPEDPYFNK